ncbi:MAG: tRNA dihydrouridine synthase [Chloroflexota bacterium]
MLSLPFLSNDLILSPMDGYSDLPFRSLCRELGSAMSYTEFINALDILQGHPHIHEKLAYLPQERPLVYQLFDNDPDRLLEAALRLIPAGQFPSPAPTGAAISLGEHGCLPTLSTVQFGQPDIIDINLGCSAKNVSGRGAGAGLLKTPAKVAAIFHKLTRALPVPVTAKMRLGWDDNSRNYLEVAKILEDNGAAAIAVHGRTKQQGYHGRADWDAIAAVRQAVSIPVYANGDVRSVVDIERIQAHTGCSAVLIGRGAIGNPWIFARLDRQDVTPERVHTTLLTHLDRMLAFHGARGLILFRKHAERYLRPYNPPPELRYGLLTTTSVEAFRRLVDEAIATIEIPDAQV